MDNWDDDGVNGIYLAVDRRSGEFVKLAIKHAFQKTKDGIVVNYGTDAQFTVLGPV
jgi:hypothetical protein